MKTILMKRVPQSTTKEIKEKLFSNWGNEAYVKPTPKISIDLIKSRKATS